MKGGSTKIIETGVCEDICGSQGGEYQNHGVLTPRDFLFFFFNFSGKPTACTIRVDGKYDYREEWGQSVTTVKVK